MFGQVTVNATDYLRITGGVRYTDEDKQSLYESWFCRFWFIDTSTFTRTILSRRLDYL